MPPIDEPEWPHEPEHPGEPEDVGFDVPPFDPVADSMVSVDSEDPTAPLRRQDPENRTGSGTRDWKSAVNQRRETGSSRVGAPAAAKLTVPAADPMTERALLASCLVDPEALPLAQSHVVAADFYDQRHAWLYQAMIDLATRSQPIDAVSVYTELTAQKNAEAVGMAYLVELTDHVGSTLAVEHHAKRISRLSAVRKILRAGQKIQSGYEHGDDPDEFILKAETEVSEALRQTVRSAAVPLDVIVHDVYSQIMAARQRGGELLGIPTGFRDLDRLTQGLHPTNLVILAARPAMGKTALALNIALDVALRPRREPDERGNLQHGVLIFSMEMGREELVQRLLSARARLELTRLRKGELNPDEESVLRDVAAELSEARFLIDDTPGLTTSDLRARAKLAQMQGPLDLIVVDYLQLARGTNPRQSREQEIGEISRMLKGLAKELRCTVLALAQLNRGVEQRPNKRPMMSDLRESGAIEQDADLIAFIYRDVVYSKDPAMEHIAELIIAKQRAGSTGDLKLHFEGRYTRFSNLDQRIGDEYAGVDRG